jgi:hypothetical protein
VVLFPAKTMNLQDIECNTKKRHRTSPLDDAIIKRTGDNQRTVDGGRYYNMRVNGGKVKTRVISRPVLDQAIALSSPLMNTRFMRWGRFAVARSIIAQST